MTYTTQKQIRIERTGRKQLEPVSGGVPIMSAYVVLVFLRSLPGLGGEQTSSSGRRVSVWHRLVQKENPGGVRRMGYKTPCGDDEATRRAITPVHD